ncbi:hypothetical protein EK21DRAFT_51653 [Setomelanomma holmii]|uniref:Telomere-associated protein Rif1 N-terminal domain-containing protein n=1 Tax=Setomelanomma holmii TaxID=210430 RepID=A0A9P4HN39_9PLEO|nr:hypothetical protein EK21DRAFT_51653 [Setomelanomma holmii]
MVFSKFDSLPARPPTPPVELHDHQQDADETLQFLEDPFGEKPALPKAIATTKNLLSTPEQSPSSDISIPSSSASRQKRVEFELQTCTVPPKKTAVSSWTPTRSSPLRPLPQTRVFKPLKSILKPSDATPTPPPADEAAAAHKFKTFAEMLESIVKLLASAERPSRMDAYHSLQRTMQAYDKIPDDQALKNKMSLLTQFVRRDIQAPSPTGMGLDSQMVSQALKLLMALFRISDAAAAMDDEFCGFIIDRSIQVAADSTMPKAIVNTHLATLMQQNFRVKVMTATRVEKIMDVLDTIHERINGFSVQAYRIRIHRRLIQQRPDLMIKYTERWLKHTVKALMAGQKDINQSALDIALTAAKTIGHDRHVAKSCLAFLNRVRNDGDTIAKVFAKELERMLGGDNAILVPQIWSAVTVLLRDSLQSIAFPTLKEWLVVFEKCIASEKDAIRMIQRGELPLLDPKWVRKSLSVVLQFVETLLGATPWVENEQEADEPVKAMWLAVLDSLVEASSKEVMASSETKDAMAQIVNFLRRIWDRHTAQLALSQQNEDTWANQFCFLIETVVQKLGPKHFADKFLMRNGADEFEVASTPSHRSRQHGARTSPLLYFIDLLLNQSEGKLPDAVRLRAIKLILEPGFDAQNTRLNRLELLRDCSATVDSSLTAAVWSSFWSHITALVRTSLQEPKSESSEHVSRPLGKEYDFVVDILELVPWQYLTDAHGHNTVSIFIDTVRREAGDGAVILAAIEKVSEIVAKTGSAAYHNFRVEHVESTSTFLAALAVSIRDCATSQLAVFLRKTQGIVRLWVEDADRKLQSKEQPSKVVHREVVGLWTEVCKALERLPRKDVQILLHLEPLVTAGFVSRRRSIVNLSIVIWNKTFGKEESLRYPAKLEKALRRLRTSVDISLPSLIVSEEDANDNVSFYDSDDTTEDVQPALRSTRIKESPFKISKSARRSLTRSPAASSPASRRVSGRQTPKVRLRHDNSQIQFEPIVSSPSNPFDQESQILTERQREMVERQRLSGGLFANMGAPSPQKDEVPSPMELHSDALTADDLPTDAARTTPLKALAAMGPMDVFLGSSPTPHARRTSRKIISDETSVATPTAVRTVEMDDNDDLGSSPPRFEKADKDVEQPNSDICVASSFDYRQPETPFDMSFDEGTTIDEDALLNAATTRADVNERSQADIATDTAMSELPSSTIDLQLTAQLDADIQAQMAAGTEDTDEPASESLNVFVDAASHPQPSLLGEHGSDTEVDESQPPMPAAIKVGPVDDEVDTSSTSRVGDSFSKPSSDKGTPRSQSLRRSIRHSAASSPAQSPSMKKRKSRKSESAPEQESKEEQAPQQQPAQPSQPDEDGMLDNIIVASPAPRNTRPKKRKSMNEAASPTVDVPETHKKRGPVRRSQSLLSQVENSQDVIVEDTPAPKRAKQNAAQDVSEARSTPPPQPPVQQMNSQTKLLSHVQVTPKRSSEHERSIRGSRIILEGPPPATELETQIRIQEPVDNSASTPSRSFTERVILTPRSIINQLKSLKDYLFSAKELVIGREEEREIDDALFDIRRRVHAAGARGENDEGRE